MSFEKRKAARRNVHCRALIVAANKSVVSDCAISDVSDTGARLRLATTEALPDEFYLVLSKGAKVRRLCTVRWRSKNNVGVEFASSKAQ